MDNVLQQGIAAAKSGDKARAFQLLTRATQDNATVETAWLWLSAVVETEAECLFCLDNALRINPGNVPAQNKVATLRQKGVFPAVPMPPQAQVPAPSAPARLSSPSPVVKPVPPSQPTQKNPQVTHQPKGPDIKSQQEISGLYKFVATELANKQLPQVIVKRLTDQGVTPATASKVVAETQKIFKKARADKHKKQMTRGLLWLVGGIILTCGTLAFASNIGGRYILFYGAIGYGLIDFIAGLVGWLSNR